MYGFIHDNSELLAPRLQFRILTANTGPEKGPDFIGINRRGQLVLGEIKAGPLSVAAWNQIKGYAKKFAKMKKSVLEQYIGRNGEFLSLEAAGRNLLSSKAKRALSYPSKRRLLPVLVAETFSDNVLRAISKRGSTAFIRRFVNDVKCIEMQVFRVKAPGTIVATAIVAGRARGLKK